MDRPDRPRALPAADPRHLRQGRPRLVARGGHQSHRERRRPGGRLVRGPAALPVRRVRLSAGGAVRGQRGAWLPAPAFVEARRAGRGRERPRPLRLGALARLRSLHARLRRARSRPAAQPVRRTAAGSGRNHRRARQRAPVRCAGTDRRHHAAVRRHRCGLQSLDGAFLAVHLRKRGAGDRERRQPAGPVFRCAPRPPHRRGRGHRAQGAGRGPAQDPRRRTRAGAHPGAGAQGRALRTCRGRAPGHAVRRPARRHPAAAALAARAAAGEHRVGVAGHPRVHLAPDREEARGFQRRRERGCGLPGPGHHPTRSTPPPASRAARSSTCRRTWHARCRWSRAAGGRDHPGQEPDGPRHPIRGVSRTAVRDPRPAGLCRERFRVDHGAGQGHRRQPGGGRPGKDAAPAGGRHHRLGQARWASMPMPLSLLYKADRPRCA